MTGTTPRTGWWSRRRAPSRRLASTVGREPWASGPLLPFGWRPDREGPPEEGVDRRCAVVDRYGHLHLDDGTGIASPGRSVTRVHVR